jgi:hypothetical protein
LWLSVSCLFFLLASSLGVVAQQGTSEFTLSAASFNPAAVAPSGVAASQITVGFPAGSSTSVTVNLSCQVTSQQTATSPPACSVSPSSVTTPATAVATVTTESTTTTQAYGITITGTGPTTTFTTQALPLTVLAVSPQFTINVTGAIAPGSVPAGNGSQGTVVVNPVNGYSTPSGGITLSCASMSPLVTIAPVCSFNPNGALLQLKGTSSVTSTINISTFGPVTTGPHEVRGGGFGLWFAWPLLGLVGVGAAASGNRRRGAALMLSLLVLCGVFILTPACSSSPTTTTTPNGVTPSNTYTFTIVGVDANGVVSSNTTSSTTAPTVTLTVTAPPKTP